MVKRIGRYLGAQAWVWSSEKLVSSGETSPQFHFQKERSSKCVGVGNILYIIILNIRLHIPYEIYGTIAYSMQSNNVTYSCY